MKKIFSILFTSCLAFIISVSISTKDAKALTYKAGDILVTDKTKPAGLAGHSAIVIDSKHVLHTSGWKTEPYPKVMTIKKWSERYGNRVKVVRPKSAAKGKAAASNAKKYFENKKLPYSLKAKLKSTEKTYCSQLVWYSYYQAGITFKVSYVVYKNNFEHRSWSIPTMIKPYDFSNFADAEYNGFKIIDGKF